MVPRYYIDLAFYPLLYSCFLAFKMSKSIGNVIDPFLMLDVLGTDMTRYYLMKEARLHSDSGG